MTGPTGRALPLPPEWMADASCAEIGGEAWFPDKGGSTWEAKRICGRCDVKAKCLEYALSNGERFGIWGGLSERERRRLGQAPAPRTRQVAVCGTEAGYAAHRRRKEPSCGPCLEGLRAAQARRRAERVA